MCIRDRGATLATGGHRLEGRGYYYEPTIFVDVDNTMRIAQEEIFGPVLVVIPFDGEQEAIAIANDTIYGLAGAVWAKDVTKAMRVVKAVRAGITWVNTYHPTYSLSLIHISEPTRLGMISYAVFCLKKK